MYWPKFSEARFIKKLKTQETPSGVSCSYLQWTQKVGLKLFTSKRERDHSLRGQKLAAKHDLAPLTGEKVDLEILSCEPDGAPHPHMRKLYGFFTQTAKIGAISWGEEEMLSEALSDIGVMHHDLHLNNTGKLGKRIVAIDFDTCSCWIKKKKKKKKKKRKRKKR